jgi:aryl-alcohol dehydrogenase-like predicted oxidoreductase
MKVSELCLGAMTFGRESPEDISYQILDRFVEAGGNFIDTADVYSQGVSETILGRWMKGNGRDQLVIATKVRFPMGANPNDVGLSRKHILQAVEASLRRLQTDYIDLYQVHLWDNRTPLEETLSTLDTLARQMSWEPFTCLQALYNLLDRELEWELVPVCQNEGLGLIPWSPLRGGWLSGRYRRGMSAPPANSRVEDATKFNWSESWEKYNTERTWKVVDALLEVAAESSKHPAQVALNWLLHSPGVTAPIIGARTMEQLEINLGASGWALEPALMQRLNQASAMELPYPYGFIKNGAR